MKENNPVSTQPIDELINQRMKKISQLISIGINPYPTGKWKPTHLNSQIILEFSGLNAGEEKKDAHVKVAGRITLRRTMGKASFFDLIDSTGKIQVYIKQDNIGTEKYKLFTDLVDIGDIVGVEGHIFKTKTAELSVFAADLVMLSKSLRPLPEKWHGLRDPEIRYRHRYLDLISSSGVREIFKKRSKIIDAIRQTLKKNNFQEVETPMLQSIPGGALAKPFITYHNALGINLHLRIAPELYLKRLLVGGFERVFEIGKSFRNEGIDRRHNPEFTMVEIYQAYADYEDMMLLCEEIIKSAARVLSSDMIFEFEGIRFNLNQPFKRISFFEAIERYSNRDFAVALQEGRLIDEAKSAGLEIPPQMPRHKILDAVFEKFVVGNLNEPTFVCDYPSEFSPLAQVKSDNPFLAERFELFIAGQEIANAYSELNNPILQREKFIAQQKLKDTGADSDAVSYDEDYLYALEYAMPPAGGLGIGIDRLTMVLTGTPSIREVILFPTLRPE